jgi:hypothetical protein
MQFLGFVILAGLAGVLMVLPHIMFRAGWANRKR